MKYEKFCYANLIISLIAAVVYFVLAIISAISLELLQKFSFTLSMVVGVAPWCGLIMLIFSVIAFFILRAGKNNGGKYFFLCTQLQIIGTVLVSAFIALVILVSGITAALSSIGGDVALNVLDRIGLPVVCLHICVVPILNSVAAFVRIKETFAPVDPSLPVNPFYKRDKSANIIKAIIITIEAAAALGFFVLMAIVSFTL